MKKKNGLHIVILWMLAAILACILGVSRLEQGRQAEGKRQLEEALRRTAVACYAAEGFYPPNVAYMQTHYGLQYDQGQYIIYYDVYASNLMPDITVLEK